MVDVGASIVIKTIYQVVFEQIRSHTVSSIESGDVALDDLKEQLSTEFEKIHAKLNTLLDAPFHAAQRHLTDALIYTFHQKYTEALVEFAETSNQAILAFEQSTTFDKKVLATKLRFISTLHINHYFDPNIRDMKLIHDLIITIWNDFLTLTEVRTSIRDEFGGNSIMKMINSDSRKDILYKVASVKAIVSQILQMEPKIPCSTRGEVVELYNIKPISMKAHNDGVGCVYVHGDLLFTGSCDHTIKVWDMSSLSFNHITTFKGHTSDVRALVALNGRLYSGGSDQTIRCWDILSFSPQPTVVVSNAHENSINSLVTWKDKLFSCSHDSNVKVWNLKQSSSNTISSILSISSIESTKSTDGSHETITEECVLKGHTGWVFSLLIYDSKLYSASINRNNCILAWDIESSPMPTTPLHVFTGSCHAYAITIANGMLFSGHHDHSISIYDISSNSPSYTPIGCLHGHSGWVLGLASTSSRLYSSSGDHTIKVWDILSKPIPDKPLVTLEGHHGIVHGLTVNSGKLISGSADKHFNTWCV